MKIVFENPLLKILLNEIKKRTIELIEARPDENLEYTKMTFIYNISITLILGFSFISIASLLNAPNLFKFYLLTFNLLTLWLATNPISFIISIVLTFHPDRNEIINEVNSFRRMNEVKPIIIKSSFRFPKFEELEKYCENNISKSRAFKQLVHKFCYKNEDGLYEKSVLIWKQFIPFSLVDENTALELLKNVKISPEFGNPKNIPELALDYLFINYSNKQIKTLFYSNFDGNHYIKLLYKYSNKTKEAFPVFSRMPSY